MLQPIVVRERAGRYEIVAGERRWRAARSLGLEHVPVVVRDASDEEMLELALIENIQREDLNAMDRARAYRAYCTRFTSKPEDLARRLGEDRTTVVNYLRLLDLPEAVQRLVAEDRLSMGHARCLLGVTTESRQMKLAEAAVEHDLSVRALEGIVRREKAEADEAPVAPNAKERARKAHLYELQERFMDAVRTKVTIHEGKRKGSGRIVIEYYSLDDFDRIASSLGVALE
jgi:ParB family chromosome partitioning protein